MAEIRTLVLVLGDQLSLDTVCPANFDSEQDVLWMAESGHEGRRVWSHKARIVLFVSAMRHFRRNMESQGHRLIYRQSAIESIAELLARDLVDLRPSRVVLTRPGDWDLLQELSTVLDASTVPWQLQEDSHFLTTPDQFRQWAGSRTQFRMEHFYREQRRRTGILMEPDGTPVGGEWNYDAENRASFGRSGPGELTPPLRFAPDDLTQSAIDQVLAQYADHPGSLDAFDWPVTREQALQALTHFVSYMLPMFGQYQDAMWLNEPWLYHSRLSSSLNLHLLHPAEVITAAVQAYDAGYVPLAAAEGFIRQILGWREFVRGLYWLRMPLWREENFFSADQPLPASYWSGQTEMACLRDALASTLNLGYAHHIQRLMVTGLFALLLGVRPSEIEAWYHAVYVDAVSWVELPNTLGMSQFVDGGVLASKPYLASGAYIQRMSNACTVCRYRPEQRHGSGACPITVLYWDFLLRHEPVLRRQPRLKMQLLHLQRMDEQARAAIRDYAITVRRQANENG